jgi:hypothetical protein
VLTIFHFRKVEKSTPAFNIAINLFPYANLCHRALQKFQNMLFKYIQPAKEFSETSLRTDTATDRFTYQLLSPVDSGRHSHALCHQTSRDKIGPVTRDTSTPECRLATGGGGKLKTVRSMYVSDARSGNNGRKLHVHRTLYVRFKLYQVTRMRIKTFINVEV